MSSNTTGSNAADADVVRSTGASLLDQIDVALYALDADGLCVRINRAAEELLGYTQAELAGRNMHETVHHHRPDGSPYPVEECPLFLARSSQGAITGVEEVLWNRDGQPVPVECSASPVAMEDGRIGAIVTFKDLRGKSQAERDLQAVVDEQRESLRQRDAAARVAGELAAEEAARQREAHASLERVAADQIREQQELLATVAETAPVGIAVFDADVRYRWTNASYARSMDPAFQAIDLRGTSYFDTIPAGNEQELRGIFAGVQATGQAFAAAAYPLQGVDRGTTYWRWSLSRLANGDLMSTGADVTEQVTTRREVEAVYANAPIALSLLDAASLQYLRVNVQYANLFGVTPEAMLGKRTGTFSTSAEGEALLQQVIAGRTIENKLLQVRIFSDPDTERSLLVNATPNRNETGAIDTISLALTDVTAQKRAEDALVQADKLAAVGRLAASISHEINNPLEAVTNLLYLVHQDETLSAETRGYVEQAEDELRRVSQIASQTLRFQRHAVQAVPVTAPQLVDPVVALYQGRLKHTRIRVMVEHRGPQQQMVVFEGDVRQILNNLLGNAIDAMAEGGTIAVRTQPARCVHTRRHGTRISIADQGHGMSEDTAAHIFEPFFTTKGSGGSGLGLWISHTLAQRHGGGLRVRSRQAASHRSGKSGTVFSLFLPNVEPNQVAGRHEALGGKPLQ